MLLLDCSSISSVCCVIFLTCELLICVLLKVIPVKHNSYLGITTIEAEEGTAFSKIFNEIF